MPYRIGIDAGSKTIKIVALDERGNIAFHLYWRHRSNIRRTLTRMLEDFIERYGNLEGSIAVTGSAGIAVAKMLGLPFVQEVIATTTAVRERYAHADAIVELGGEDAKVVYLTGKLEQRMNATCAGGTGGFIDTMASMLGVRAAEMDQLAKRSTHEYSIASRCAVFAQTDVRPLLASGASKEDIAASALSAVVRQTLGGLACGRPLRGTIVFLGGPFEYIPELAKRFRTVLGLDETTGIRPEQAHLFTACGAAIEGGRIANVDYASTGADPDRISAFGAPDSPRLSDTTAMLGQFDDGQNRATAATAAPNHANCLSLLRLQQLVAKRALPEDDLRHLPPLFESAEERRAFDERHAVERYPRTRFFDSAGPLYLGFDAGSTTVKYALLNQRGELVSSGYRASDGNVLETALVMLSQLYRTIPPSADVYIAQSVVVGYGDELLRSALRIDSDVVETTAHLRAASHLCPDVTFVLDIGGQDMKALWVKNGQVTDAILNEACSSGCGAFIEATARSLGMTREGFATAALESSMPFDLGTKCTVFMTSRVRHAQKAGADASDIAAGIAYSVVQNALYRVIGRDKSIDIGKTVVVQGGTFKSDAVLRAFEKVANVDAVRPNTAHLMGAIGAALIARDRAEDLAHAIGNENSYVASNILSAGELKALTPRYSTAQCTGCSNACMLSLVSFGDGRHYASGNRCSKGQAFAERLLVKRGSELVASDDSALPRMRKHRKRRTRTEAGFNPLANATLESIAGTARPAPEVPDARIADEDDITMIGVGLPLRDADEDESNSVKAAAHAETSVEKRTKTRKIRIVPPKHGDTLPDGKSAFDYMAETMHVSLTNLYCLNRSTRSADNAEDDTETLVAGCRSGKRPIFRDLEEDRCAGDGAPNIVKVEQRLLAAYGDVAAGSRPGAIVGLPDTLSNYEQKPFWHVLLSQLGFGVVVPDETRTRAVREIAAESIPSESVCEPAKITHARLFDLRMAGANTVLLPRYERGNRCPVMCGYADALIDNVEFLANGSLRVIAPLLRPTEPARIATNELNVNSIYESLRDLDASRPVLRCEFDIALERALTEHAAFVARVQAATDEALAWIEADKRRSGIVIAGRPYHVDAALMHGIDDVVERLGFAAIPALGLKRQADAFNVDAAWKPAKHLLKLAQLVIGNPALDMVVLQSFNCGYDAISLGDVREVLTNAGRTFTALKIDEIVDTAHIRIRLRTMAEAIEARRRRERICAPNQSVKAEGTTEEQDESRVVAVVARDFEHDARSADTDALNQNAAKFGNVDNVPQIDRFESLTPLTSAHDAAHCVTAQNILDSGISACDLGTARSSSPADICFTAAALVAHAVNLINDGKHPEILCVPKVCQGCMIDALPHLVGRVCDHVPDIAWEHTETSQLAPPTISRDKLSHPAHPAASVRIGIVGNPLLCFDEYMNENLADLLAKLDAEPVWPDPANLYVDDVRYFEQLDAFAAQSVDAVLYLQSFGCLKGHVQARGAAHCLAARYPHMPITILDYDPESSALNRENRIRLAVAAAKTRQLVRRRVWSKPDSASDDVPGRGSA